MAFWITSEIRRAERARKDEIAERNAGLRFVRYACETLPRDYHRERRWRQETQAPTVIFTGIVLNSPLTSAVHNSLTP